jgi:hypothetical protein
MSEGVVQNLCFPESALRVFGPAFNRTAPGRTHWEEVYDDGERKFNTK